MKKRSPTVRVRIVVADQSEARFYEIAGRAAPLRLTGRLLDPAARLHDRDFKSDRPGRVFDRAPRPGARRGATAHHATGGERRPRKQQALRFARQIARRLGTDLRQDRFDRIVLMAGPAFLGMLRPALSSAARACVAAEARKDLVHLDDDAVRAHIPAEVFRDDWNVA